MDILAEAAGYGDGATPSCEICASLHRLRLLDVEDLVVGTRLDDRLWLLCPNCWQLIVCVAARRAFGRRRPAGAG